MFMCRLQRNAFFEMLFSETWFSTRATQLALSKSKKKELLSSALQVKGKTCAFLISCLGSVISQMTRAARVSLEKHCCGWALLLEKNLQRIDFELEDFLHLHDSTVLFDPPKSSNYKSSKTQPHLSSRRLIAEGRNDWFLSQRILCLAMLFLTRALGLRLARSIAHFWTLLIFTHYFRRQ